MMRKGHVMYNGDDRVQQVNAIWQLAGDVYESQTVTVHDYVGNLYEYWHDLCELADAALAEDRPEWWDDQHDTTLLYDRLWESVYSAL